jgi:hypothetical protein
MPHPFLRLRQNPRNPLETPPNSITAFRLNITPRLNHHQRQRTSRPRRLNPLQSSHTHPHPLQIRTLRWVRLNRRASYLLRVQSNPLLSHHPHHLPLLLQLLPLRCRLILTLPTCHRNRIPLRLHFRHHRSQLLIVIALLYPSRSHLSPFGKEVTRSLTQIRLIILMDVEIITAVKPKMKSNCIGFRFLWDFCAMCKHGVNPSVP